MRNVPPKNNRFNTSYIFISTTSLPIKSYKPGGYHLATRLLLKKCIMRVKAFAILIFRIQFHNKKVHNTIFSSQRNKKKLNGLYIAK